MKVRTKSPETSVTDDGNYFQFRFEPCHIEKGKRGQKIYVCDICHGVFKRSFSLKRHYLRFHINYAFLSPRDLNNCAIVASNHRALTTSQNGSGSNDSTASKKSNLLYRCHQCGFLVASKADLLHHLETHPTTEASGEEYVNGVNRCPKCSTAFTLRKTLRRHIKKNRCRNPNPSKDEGEEKEKKEENGSVDVKHEEEETLTTLVVDDAMDDLEEIDMEASLKMGCSTSLFRFACTICSRMFQTYVNMCRHRRLAHGRFGICSPNLLVSRNKSKSYLSLYKMVPAKNLLKDSSTNDCLRDFVEIADVNHRLFIDGKRPHIISSKPPIPEEDPQLSPAQQEEEDQLIKKELEMRWTWGPTNYNINELMRLDIPVQQAFFRGLSRWKPDEVETTADHTAPSHASDDAHISSVLNLRAVKNVQENATTGSDGERPEFCGELTRLKSYICFPCGQVFQDYYQLQEHQLAAHSFVYYRHIELDETRESVLPDIRNQVIRVYCKERIQDQDAPKSHQCTKCHATLNSIPDLHSHILLCSNYISSSPRKRRSRIMGNSRRNHWHNATGERKRGPVTYSTISKSYSKTNNRTVRSRSPKDEATSENGDSARRRSTRRVLNFSESSTNANLKNGVAKRKLRERSTSSANVQSVSLSKKKVPVEKGSKKKKQEKVVLPEKRLTRAVTYDKPLPKMETCDWCKKRFQTKQSLTKHKVICNLKPVEQIVIVCDMAASDDGALKRKSSSKSVELASTSTKTEQVTTKKKSEPQNERNNRKRGVEALKEEIQAKLKSQTQVSSKQVPPTKKKKTATAVATSSATLDVKKTPTASKSQNSTPKTNDSIRTRAALKQSQQSVQKNETNRPPSTSATVATPTGATVTKTKADVTTLRKRLSDVTTVAQVSEAAKSVNGRLRSKSGAAVTTVKQMPVLKPAPVVVAPTVSPSAVEKKLPELKLGGILTVKKAIGAAAVKVSEVIKRKETASPKVSTPAAVVAKKTTVSSPKTPMKTPALAGPSSTKRQSSSKEEKTRMLRNRHSDVPSTSKSTWLTPVEVEETTASTRPVRSSRRTFSLSGDSLVNGDIEKSFLEALLPEQRIKIAEQTCPFCSKHYVYRNNFKKHLLEGCDTPDAEESTPSKTVTEEAKTPQIRSSEKKPQPTVDQSNELKKKSNLVFATKSSPKVKKMPMSLPKIESNGQRAGTKASHVAREDANENKKAKNNIDISVLSTIPKADHLGVDQIDSPPNSDIGNCRTEDNIPPIKEEQVDVVSTKPAELSVDVPSCSTPRASDAIECPEPLPEHRNEDPAIEESVASVEQDTPTLVETCHSDMERHAVQAELDTNKDVPEEEPETVEQKQDTQVELKTPETTEEMEVVEASVDVFAETEKASVPLAEQVDKPVEKLTEMESSSTQVNGFEDSIPVDDLTTVSECKESAIDGNNANDGRETLSPKEIENSAVTLENSETMKDCISSEVDCPAGSSSVTSSEVVSKSSLQDQEPESKEESESPDVECSVTGGTVTSSEDVPVSCVEESERNPAPPVSDQTKDAEQSSPASKDDITTETQLSHPVTEAENCARFQTDNKEVVAATIEDTTDAKEVPLCIVGEDHASETSDNHSIAVEQVPAVPNAKDDSSPAVPENSEDRRVIETLPCELTEVGEAADVKVDHEENGSVREVDNGSNVEDDPSADVTSNQETCDNGEAVKSISSTTVVAATEDQSAPVAVVTSTEIGASNEADVQTAAAVSDDAITLEASTEVDESSEKKNTEDMELSDCAPRIVEPFQKLEGIDTIRKDVIEGANSVSSSTDEDLTSADNCSTKDGNPPYDPAVNSGNGKCINEAVTSSDHVMESENSVDLNTHMDTNVTSMRKMEQDRDLANDSVVSKKDVDLGPVTQVNLADICSQIAANICQYPTQS